MHIFQFKASVLYFHRNRRNTVGPEHTQYCIKDGYTVRDAPPCFLEGRKKTCITHLCMHICIETARGGICAGTLRFWWQYSVRNTSRKQLEKVVIQFYCSCSEFSLTCILSSYNLILLKNRISMSPTLVN